jgi:hypothetical protein
MAIKDAFDRANPNTHADWERLIKLGKVLRGQIPQVRRKATVAADGAQLATLHSLVLPNDAKAAAITRAYARVATTGTGELTVVAPGVTPASTQVAVAPNGDIVVLATDAILSMDVTYIPERGDVQVLPELPVAADSVTVPTAWTTRGVILLIDANVTAGGSVGRKRILIPGAAAPAAGQARLNLAKGAVAFAAADAVTKVVLTFLVCAADDLHIALEMTETSV